MIKKERLEELLEQGATIYEAYPDGIDKINLANTAHYDYLLAQQELKIQKIAFEYLHETKEDAEFFREFGFIERTERLELPSWGRVNVPHNVIVNFISKDGLMYNLVVENYERIIIVSSVRGTNDMWDLTKENYILACRKCKALFLGEEK